MAFDLAPRADVRTGWPYARCRAALGASFADRGLAAPLTSTRGWPAWTAAALAVTGPVRTSSAPRAVLPGQLPHPPVHGGMDLPASRAGDQVAVHP
ncbi:hypothetical protein ABZU88_41710, partial [Streptomyces sp. NPDC005245]